ncbi:MAG: peptide chain release factor N(5)-glutamine methyltransferase [Clostridiales bacterium]|nr:peptide chain release factor N(5)-glutamine methyltransferase [Clostridiales bacterium]
MTYAEVYESGVKELERAEIEEARLDARLLLEYVCHTTRQDLLAHGERVVTEEEGRQYDGLIVKRALHIPLQYLTGVQEFMGLEFQVNENVLVPRQDTEVLVEEAVRFLHDGMRILDMCTGSGCILLSLLHYSNDCEGVGADISESALAVAKQNAERIGVSEAVRFVRSDLFSDVEGKFDMIISNPPYIRTDVIPTLMEEVREHEPMEALDGGDDGLFFYRRIIEEAPAYLNGGGQLFFEIGYDQADAVMILLASAGFKDIALVQDFAGNDRVVSGTWY